MIGSPHTGTPVRYVKPGSSKGLSGVEWGSEGCLFGWWGDKKGRVSPAEGEGVLS
jgi:hypothetical protein